MKIKLDENIPVSLASFLEQLGHHVDTGPQEGLAGAKDAALFQAAQRDDRFFITQDLDFSDIRKFRPGAHHGLLLDRLVEPGRKARVKRLQQVFNQEDIESWKRCFVVVSARKIRVRRPEQR